MTVPTSWPPRPASGRRSIRFYKTGSLTANFADNCWIFGDAANNANPYTPLPEVVSGISGSPTVVPPTPWGGGTNDPGSPVSMIWSGAIRVTVTGGDLEFSFDSANPPVIVHGKVLSGSSVVYLDRFESGMAVRGTGTFYVEAW